ncbi:hypothetical protein BJ508DRAFT_378811 [Ascobolus immersus RN42]|uniref:Uncharacterized protein n=1 Tax=Ascobolus immersus RN42 TaxID=1160509 RepID=A0A3N4I705_ASCIM|nr:hypothetical protein BJ508DRAFT_378811 [Ascobolus immersus RN42]
MEQKDTDSTVFASTRDPITLLTFNNFATMGSHTNGSDSEDDTRRAKKTPHNGRDEGYGRSILRRASFLLEESFRMAREQSLIYAEVLDLESALEERNFERTTFNLAPVCNRKELPVCPAIAHWATSTHPLKKHFSLRAMKASPFTCKCRTLLRGALSAVGQIPIRGSFWRRHPGNGNMPWALRVVHDLLATREGVQDRLVRNKFDSFRERTPHGNRYICPTHKGYDRVREKLREQRLLSENDLETRLPDGFAQSQKLAEWDEAENLIKQAKVEESGRSTYCNGRSYWEVMSMGEFKSLDAVYRTRKRILFQHLLRMYCLLQMAVPAVFTSESVAEYYQVTKDLNASYLATIQAFHFFRAKHHQLHEYQSHHTKHLKLNDGRNEPEASSANISDDIWIRLGGCRLL